MKQKCLKRRLSQVDFCGKIRARTRRRAKDGFHEIDAVIYVRIGFDGGRSMATFEQFNVRSLRSAKVVYAPNHADRLRTGDIDVFLAVLEQCGRKRRIDEFNGARHGACAVEVSGFESEEALEGSG